MPARLRCRAHGIVPQDSSTDPGGEEEVRRNQSHHGESRITRPKRLPCIWSSSPQNASAFMLQCEKRQPDAFAARHSSFSTVFQLRAVLGTPMPLSNFADSFEFEKPRGVCR